MSSQLAELGRLARAAISVPLPVPGQDPLPLAPLQGSAYGPPRNDSPQPTRDSTVVQLGIAPWVPIVWRVGAPYRFVRITYLSSADLTSSGLQAWIYVRCGSPFQVANEGQAQLQMDGRIPASASSGVGVIDLGRVISGPVSLAIGVNASTFPNVRIEVDVTPFPSVDPPFVASGELPQSQTLSGLAGGAQAVAPTADSNAALAATTIAALNLKPNIGAGQLTTLLAGVANQRWCLHSVSIYFNPLPTAYSFALADDTGAARHWFDNRAAHDLDLGMVRFPLGSGVNLLSQVLQGGAISVYGSLRYSQRVS